MNRRANHEGSIRQRQNGTWEARVSLPGGRRVSIYGKTRGDVQKEFHRILNDAENGISSAKGSVTVSDFLEQWYVSVETSLRTTTAIRYKGIIVRDLNPLLGNIQLKKLSVWHVEELFRRKAEDGLSPRSIWHIRAVLRTALNRAIKWELVSKNVAAIASCPRVTETKIEPFSIEELSRLLEKLQGCDLLPIVITAMGTGLRIGEILGLRWEDIDFIRQVMHVRQSLHLHNGNYELLEPKTKRSVRTLPLPSIVASALKERLIDQQVDREVAQDAWQVTIPYLVFTTPIGRPRNNSSLTHRFEEFLEAAGIPKRSFHALRHTWATLALGSGVDLKTVSTMLGHSQISLTADTYASVMISLTVDASDKVQRSLGEIRGLNQGFRNR